jgi:hypothetical protein
MYRARGARLAAFGQPRDALTSIDASTACA